MGQLGLGPDVLDRTKPAKVGDLDPNFTVVVAGGMHTVCVDEEGSVSTILVLIYSILYTL